MATRTFCDHCGNTCREPKVFSYGPLAAIRAQEDMVQLQMRHHILRSQQAGIGGSGAGAVGGGGAGGAVGVVVTTPLIAPPKPVGTLIHVDLCDHCVPLWMQRVAAITKASDPEGE